MSFNPFSLFTSKKKKLEKEKTRREEEERTRRIEQRLKEIQMKEEEEFRKKIAENPLSHPHYNTPSVIKQNKMIDELDISLMEELEMHRSDKKMDDDNLYKLTDKLIELNRSADVYKNLEINTPEKQLLNTELKREVILLFSFLMRYVYPKYRKIIEQINYVHEYYISDFYLKFIKLINRIAVFFEVSIDYFKSKSAAKSMRYGSKKSCKYKRTSKKNIL